MTSEENKELSNITRVYEVYQDMEDELLNEVEVQINGNKLTKQDKVNIIITKVRDYNRKWNKMAENDSNMLKDGFLNLMRNKIRGAVGILPQTVINAARYL